jgi:glycosyltransferase involved in cell wall biosynthesis
MKILHINASDVKGGAARAAHRLHTGLQALGADSRMLVQKRLSHGPDILASTNAISEGFDTMRLSFDALPLKFYKQRQKTAFSTQWLPDRILPKIRQFSPDIIHLHWINQGFVQIETLAKLGIPMIWTLHDMWPFTGGCHYAEDCLGYRNACGTCPHLGSAKANDLSHWIWKRKAKSWNSINLTMVAPSQWMADCAASSSLFQHCPIDVIPHGLDLDVYKPIDRNVARDILSLPPDAKLVLFGSAHGTSEKRKGFHFLLDALTKLSQLSEGSPQIQLAVFGQTSPDRPIDFGFKTHYLGTFQDDLSLSLVYSAADVMVVPSLQEAFGQTAFEAMACGVPVVAFDATGLKDIVEHKENGFLAQPFDTTDMAKGLHWMLSDPETMNFLGQQARKKAEAEYSVTLQADRYLALSKRLKSKVS